MWHSRNTKDGGIINGCSGVDGELVKGVEPEVLSSKMILGSISDKAKNDVEFMV